MKAPIIVNGLGIIFCFAIGIWFTFYSTKAREYYFKIYKDGIEKSGFLTSWIDKYPNPWFFKLFGILFLIVSAILSAILIKKLQG